MASRTKQGAIRRGFAALLAYLAALTFARVVLWCYLLWYLVIVIAYFDPKPAVWLTSLGLSLIIGFALLLNAGLGAKTAARDRWQTFRFFAMPFCVSSFAALVKGQGFVLVFSPRSADVAVQIVICAAFVAATRLARFVVERNGRGVDRRFACAK